MFWIQWPDVQLKAVTRPFASQYVRNSIMSTHNFHRGYGQNTVGHTIQQNSSVLKIQLCENKRKRILVRFPFVFSNVLSEQRREEERWKEADAYTASTRFCLRYVTYHSLDT